MNTEAKEIKEVEEVEEVESGAATALDYEGLYRYVEAENRRLRKALALMSNDREFALILAFATASEGNVLKKIREDGK